MRSFVIGVGAMLVFLGCGLALQNRLAFAEQQAPQPSKATSAKPAPTPEELDQLLAPIALYPDQLLAQMLLSATNPGKVGALGEWLASQTLKGSELQDAATEAGFEPSFVALVLFPHVVDAMAAQIGLDARTRAGVRSRTGRRSSTASSV